MDFSEAITAQIHGRNVRRATLLEFDFLTTPVLIANTVRRLKTKDGKEWRGTPGLIGRIEGLQQAINGAAPELRLTVSGVDPGFAAKVKGEASEYFNRTLRIYGQFLDEDWKVLDSPFALAWAQMRSITPKMQTTEKGIMHSLTLNCETPFGSTKKRPPFSYCTSTDQKQRFPGDTGMDRVAGIEVKQITWPAA